MNKIHLSSEVTISGMEMEMRDYDDVEGTSSDMEMRNYDADSQRPVSATKVATVATAVSV